MTFSIIPCKVSFAFSGSTHLTLKTNDGILSFIFSNPFNISALCFSASWPRINFRPKVSLGANSPNLIETNPLAVFLAKTSLKLSFNFFSLCSAAETNFCVDTFN